MARRPFDPAELGPAQDRVPAGRRARPRRRRRAGRRGRRASSTSPSSSWAAARRPARVNLEGSRNVFEAAAAAPRAQRLVYTSSVAAYGFHARQPAAADRGRARRAAATRHYYSAQKAELEETLQRGGGRLAARHLRAAAVHRRRARRAGHAARRSRRPVRRAPVTVLPDPGTRVPARAPRRRRARRWWPPCAARASRAPTTSPAPASVTAADLARELGWLRVPVPRATVRLAAAGTALPLVPAQRRVAQRLQRAGADELRAGAQGAALETAPRRRGSTLAATVAAARERGLL